MFPQSYFPKAYFPQDYWEKVGGKPGGHGGGAGGRQNRWMTQEIARRIMEYHRIMEERARQSILARLVRNRMEFSRQLELTRRDMVWRSTRALILAEV